MNIQLDDGKLSEIKTDAILLRVFQDETHLDEHGIEIDNALDGYVSQLIDDGEITGKSGEITFLHTMGRLPTERIVLVGFGKITDLNPDIFRANCAEAARFLRRKKMKNVASTPYTNQDIGLSYADSVEAMTEAILLGLYKFLKRKGNHNNDAGEDEDDEFNTLTLVHNWTDQQGETRIEAEQGITKGTIIAESTMLARDLINEPANHLTPTDMAAAAHSSAENSALDCTILEQSDMESLGMGALLGVARGSHQPPKFIILTYKGDPDSDQTMCFLGKGITFDTGGISLKPAANMGAMKGDMGGGAAVIGALTAIGKLEPKINVTGIVAATENMPGGNATKPGDVLTAMNGKTIEVDNTDAEGRLVLADALSYAQTKNYSPLIDVATLTGAARVALGTVCSAIMGNDQPLIDEVIAAGEKVGEVYWQLPLFDDYKEQIKSQTADIKNSGGAPAGAITAGKFLEEFAEKTAWAHLDIAATSMTGQDKGVRVKGATGVAVRTLTNFALNRAGI
ncbi:leucyl aminopeptidase [Dehalococcoidia bacterium]|nr:leucyl aminopeptidase [Dehalococcoidia bacterium]